VRNLRPLLGRVALASFLLASPIASTGDCDTAPAAAADAPGLQEKVARYREGLAAYTKAHDAYEKLAAAYWQGISEKRRARRGKMASHAAIGLDDYVLEQPPVYAGPPQPVNPEAQPAQAEGEAKAETKGIPVVADFLRHAKAEFGFAPQRPARERDYKRAYAKAAIAAGLSKEACVKVYAFEAGGEGTYDVQAGLESDDPDARAITTALGYNQLLATNSVELLGEGGDTFVATLSKAAEGAKPARRAQLQKKIAALKKMIAFARSVPDQWEEHAKLARTPQGLGVQALSLDVDVGPLLQAQKLMTSVAFARSRGHAAPLTGAELEMMNLTGDGNGLDMVLMPADLRGKVPTANFFLRGGYKRNDVASLNNTVAKLFAATNAQMDAEADLNGAKELAAAFAAVK
jgi:hypothetical protein